VVLALKGYTAPAIAMSVGLSRRVCQAWVYRYNEQGLKGLEDRRGKSPREVLSDAQQSQVRQRLEQGLTAEDGVCSLRGVDIQRRLAAEFGVLRSLPAI
jgi:transposase